MNSKLVVALVLLMIIALGVAPSQAQGHRGHGRSRTAGRAIAVVRSAVVPRVVRPPIVNVVPYRPYAYRPGLRLGSRFGSPYGYRYRTPYSGYGPAYGSAVAAYGGVRIKGAPRDAQVYADGYYAGTVNDFDGTFQSLTLEPGAHRIEIRTPGYPPTAFDVSVQPGRTMTLRPGTP